MTREQLLNSYAIIGGMGYLIRNGFMFSVSIRVCTRIYIVSDISLTFMKEKVITTVSFFLPWILCPCPFDSES